MIVAAGKDSHGRNIVIVGITDEDITLLRNGLTKTKQGNAAYGFASLIVFHGSSDQEMLKVLSTQATLRSDDINPNAGIG